MVAGFSFAFWECTVIGGEDVLAGDKSASTRSLSAPSIYPHHPEQKRMSHWGCLDFQNVLRLKEGFIIKKN